MSREYGLLTKGAVVSSAAARLENIALSSGAISIGDVAHGALSSSIEVPLGAAQVRAGTGVAPTAFERAALRYQRLTFWAVLGLIAVSLLSR